ncbi:hypothetical protein BJI46_07830 [Acinetobacter qingfengensis]|uniref:LysR substrate-binding domain-containing protein n=1 Tax=Acinetobacter qingfengensis TaxID=1262585 RepID=A0A1E7REP8_9GAMM|nr:hypothetical protein BJI46_07830 [Acinetobacter qingfengensis]
MYKLGANQCIKSLCELTAHRCILQQHEHDLINTWNFIDQNGKTQQLNVSGYFISNSGEGIRQAALSGLDISNHSIWHVADDLKSGKLEQVLPDHQVEPTTIYAVFPHRKLIPPKNTFIFRIFIRLF